MASLTYIAPRSGIRIGHLASGAMLLLMATLATPVPAQAAGGDSKFPLIVRCELEGTERYYYLSTIKPDRRAVYLSPDHFSATITDTGEAKTISAKGTGSCADKTIEELKAAGQVLDLE